MQGQGGLSELQQQLASAGGAQENQHDQLAALARSFGLQSPLNGLPFGAVKQEESQIQSHAHHFSQVCRSLPVLRRPFP